MRMNTKSGKRGRISHRSSTSPEDSSSLISGIIPSLFAADHACIADAVVKLSARGVEHFHFDIMDGQFVPLIGLSPGLLESLVRRSPDRHFHVHLMTEEPNSLLKQVMPGATSITIHIEADRYPEATLRQIRDLGALAGIAINPATPPQLLTYLTNLVDIVLIMTATPGHEKQEFFPAILDKVREVRTLFPSHTLMIDGKVGADNIVALQKAGANSFVCGRALFSANPEEAYMQLTDLVSELLP